MIPPGFPFNLPVLAEAELVRGIRAGRESSWELQPEKLTEARQSLELISRQGDAKLGRRRRRTFRAST